MLLLSREAGCFLTILKYPVPLLFIQALMFSIHGLQEARFSGLRKTDVGSELVPYQNIRVHELALIVFLFNTAFTEHGYLLCLVIEPFHHLVVLIHFLTMRASTSTTRLLMVFFLSSTQRRRASRWINQQVNIQKKIRGMFRINRRHLYPVSRCSGDLGTTEKV